MHGFREKWKMAEYFRGQFLGNRASESAETTWYVTITNMHIPMKQVLKQMDGYGENAKMADGDGG